MTDKVGRSIARPARLAEVEHQAVSTSSFAQNYPRLYGMIGISRKNEKFHDRGCFTVFQEDGVFKIFLNDRPEGRSCCVTAVELGEAMAIAEAGLKAGTLKWRLNAQYRAKAKSVYA